MKRIICLFKFALAVSIALTIAFDTRAHAEAALINPEKIRITGEITNSTAVEFTTILNDNPNISTVELDSLGGKVYAALVIANKIHSAKINTWITGSSRCYSACSLIFLAGEMRLSDGALGVHQISGVNDPSATQSVLSDVYASLTTFRTPEKLILFMLRTPPEDTYVFSPEEIEEIGINIRPGDPKTIEPPHLQVISSTIHKDWLVGTFTNNHTRQTFIALESQAMNPVFRIVHYPHSKVTFIELVWDERRFSTGTTETRFRFNRYSEPPYDTWFTVQTEGNAFYADIPLNGGEAVERFLNAFMYGTSLNITDFSGVEVASFSLMGSLSAIDDFLELLRQTYAR